MTQQARGPAWLLDETGSAGRENLDPQHACRYDEKEDGGATEEVRLLQELGLGPDWVVVDLGAGTGQFTLAVASHCARVVAVDVSEVMLEVLGAKAAASQVPNVEVQRAGFLTYEHGGPPADLVYSRYALHHLPDFWKVLALQRMHRMLRSGGLVRLWDIVYSFEPGDAESRLAAWSSTLPDAPAAGEWVRDDIEEHIRDEHSTFSWLLEPMIERVGFIVDNVEYSDDGIFAKYVLRRP